MGMFDEKLYLTGDNGMFKVGDSFTLHEASINGTVVVNNQTRKEAKLVVSKQGDPERLTVYTSGMAIVGAIERIAPSDLPAEVKLNSRTTRNGNAHILEKA